MMRIGGLRLNLVLGKEIKGESLKDKGEALRRRKEGGFFGGNAGEKPEERKKRKMRFLRENSKKREKGVDLGLEILDFLKKRR